jgi:predicted dehydrogenase
MTVQSAPPDLRLAVVGLGLRGSIVEAAHRPGRGARVVALCDLDPARTRRWAERVHPSPWTTDDHRAVLAADDVDAVIVATPDHTHEPLVTACLEAGRTTFAEKPLAITTEGCDRILATARRTGTRLYVGHNMRHFPMVRLLKRLVDDGAIGEPKAVWCRHFVGHGGDFYFKDWHAQRANTTGLLLQKGAHDLDVIHWLAGGASRVVQGMGGLVVYGDNPHRHDGTTPAGWFDPDRWWPPAAQRGLHPVIDVEDLSMVQARLDNGVFATYQQCHFTPDYWRNYTVIGTEGRLENVGDVDGVVRLWNRRQGFSERGDHEFPFRHGDGGHGGADEALLAEFIRFARDGEPTDTSPVGAREAVAAGCAATESLRAGGVPVAVAPPDPVDAAWFAGGQR